MKKVTIDRELLAGLEIASNRRQTGDVRTVNYALKYYLLSEGIIIEDDHGVVRLASEKKNQTQT